MRTIAAIGLLLLAPLMAFAQAKLGESLRVVGVLIPRQAAVDGLTE